MTPFFGGHWFDRLDPARGDDARLAELVSHPRARLLRLDGLDPVLDDADRLTFDPIDQGDALLLLGMIDDSPTFARIAPVPPAAARSRAIFGLLDRLHRDDAPIFATARSVIDWHARHGFCPVDGSPTCIARAGWSRHCDGCGADHFPRVDPVVIMLAEHDRDILLGRQPRFPPGRYSALAGFVEPGESIEEAVARELWEEAGVRATSVTYVASQPWPFPSSLMIACLAPVAGRILTIDRTEIEDAFWATRDEVLAALSGDPAAPFIAPPPYAIARNLLESWAGSDLRTVAVGDAST
ncbi:MAG: NADH pyrophosphatase, decaps 5'-NAD modified RNA [uncultured Sphingomonadaceae bacterium]|uniref:NAD(+) diphosphatase n=1 Tax=uncultured Sphingomonadaceae bacterium TaxID=169976 RepID=A0A6J4SQ39_9SPHN|nr:MAG: NADH pyrophosphatase, decaps 5'-NAD modified RNA [uncultured Sphingomonadaceae bacterium]